MNKEWFFKALNGAERALDAALEMWMGVIAMGVLGYCLYLFLGIVWLVITGR